MNWTVRNLWGIMLFTAAQRSDFYQILKGNHLQLGWIMFQSFFHPCHASVAWAIPPAYLSSRIKSSVFMCLARRMRCQGRTQLSWRGFNSFVWNHACGILLQLAACGSMPINHISSGFLRLELGSLYSATQKYTRSGFAVRGMWLPSSWFFSLILLLPFWHTYAVLRRIFPHVVNSGSSTLDSFSACIYEQSRN